MLAPLYPVKQRHVKTVFGLGDKVLGLGLLALTATLGNGCDDIKGLHSPILALCPILLWIVVDLGVRQVISPFGELWPRG